MENKINIAELLRDCPKGMELDCTMYDNLYFDSVNTYYDTINCYTLIGGIRTSINFTKYGTFNNYIGAKCVIFPKGKTTWEGFQRPFRDGDVVAYDGADGETQLYICKDQSEINHCCLCYLKLDCDGELDLDRGWYYITRFATEKEKAKLFKAIKNKGYRWNPVFKTLEKLIEPKFKVGDVVIWKHSTITPKIIKKVQQANDRNFNYWIEGDGCIPGWCREDELQKSDKFNISTLIPFESKVLVRNDERQRWVPAFWGYKVADGFVTTFGWCKYCIPYKGNEILFKTNNDCDDFYKTWELNQKNFTK